MRRNLLPGLLIALVLMSIVMWQSFHKKTEEVSKEHCAASQESFFVTPSGEVTDPIINLLGLTGIRIAGDPLGVDSWPEAKIQIKSRKLEDVVSVVQGKMDPSITWLGDPKKERWEEDPTKPKLLASQARSIIDICFGSLRQKETTYPQSAPKAVLFLGASLSRVRMRVAYLNELYETKKLSADLPLYILTGERRLDEKIGETSQSLMDSNNGIVPFRQDWTPSQDTISDEGAMINLVFSQSRHEALENKNIITVYSPKGEGRRATTESTVIQWLKEYSPTGGTYAAISNQPYNFYQESTISRVLLQAGRSDICVEVVGPGMEANTETDDAAIDQAKNLLNNLSRILHELQEIRKIKK